MEITEVRIKLMEEPNDRLQAFCSITIEGSFVIRDLKVIQGSRGPFVAMPSRKLNDRCSGCGNKNELRASFCNNCGKKLNQERAARDQNGRAKLYADIAHPINTECREMIQNKVLAAFNEEFVKAKQPGYLCKYDDYGESEFAPDFQESDTTSTAGPQPQASAVSIPHENTLERRIDQPELEQRGSHLHTDPQKKALADDLDFGVGIE